MYVYVCVRVCACVRACMRELADLPTTATWPVNSQTDRPIHARGGDLLTVSVTAWVPQMLNGPIGHSVVRTPS